MGGYHLLYIFYQQQIKSEMKSFLKEHRSSEFCSKLVFATSDGKIRDSNFSWEEENEEFRYQHELYDVVSIEKKNGRAEIICLKDNDENQLEIQLNEIHKSDKSNSSKSTQNFLKFFSVFYLEKKQAFDFRTVEINLYTHRFSPELLIAFFEIQVPPPRC
ncbi:MAG: hypothetical protein NTZ19_03445 [Bacteroidetes bacterium]|nr:hypothetical protein [Bacteroidota bacterium]